MGELPTDSVDGQIKERVLAQVTMENKKLREENEALHDKVYKLEQEIREAQRTTSARPESNNTSSYLPPSASRPLSVKPESSYARTQYYPETQQRE